MRLRHAMIALLTSLALGTACADVTGPRGDDPPPEVPPPCGSQGSHTC